MEKGFSNNKETDLDNTSDSKKTKKGILKFLEGKKFTYTLPGKKQINIFGSIVLGLNLLLIVIAILYFNNQSVHDFVFNIGR